MNMRLRARSALSILRRMSCRLLTSMPPAVAVFVLLALGAFTPASVGAMENATSALTAEGVVGGSVSAGRQHSCAVRGDGTLVCWGFNNTGQASPPAGTFMSRSSASVWSSAMFV